MKFGSRVISQVPISPDRNKIASNKKASGRFSGGLSGSVHSYCTFAVTGESAFTVSVQVLVLAPLEEQAPAQIASRPLVTLNVTTLPGGTCTTCVLPVGTFSPPMFEITLSPARPPAVTPNDRVVGATIGFMVSVAEWLTPPPLTVMVISVCVCTGSVVMSIEPVVLPAGITTSFPTCATAGLLLVTAKN